MSLPEQPRCRAGHAAVGAACAGGSVAGSCLRAGRPQRINTLFVVVDSFNH
ncbi:protein of unknown function [Burkholderia multivorans]